MSTSLVSQIERKHTHVGACHVTTRYKAAFRELAGEYEKLLKAHRPTEDEKCIVRVALNDRLEKLIKNRRRVPIQDRAHYSGLIKGVRAAHKKFER